MLPLCRCLAHLLVGLAHFFGYLTDVFLILAVRFAVFAVALSDQPSQLRIRPLVLGSDALLLALVPVVFRTHGVYLPAPIYHTLCTNATQLYSPPNTSLSWRGRRLVRVPS